MLVLLGAALIGDLIFLPALLASPLGRFFGKTDEEARAKRLASMAAESSIDGGGEMVTPHSKSAIESHETHQRRRADDPH